MPLTTWIITDHKIGTRKQCFALAEALGLKAQLKYIKPKFPWSYLPPRFWWDSLNRIDVKEGGQLAKPWPQVIIGGGRAAAAPVAEMKRKLKDNVLTIFVQNPYLDVNDFDYIVTPKHDNLKAPNVIQTEGALHNLTTQFIGREAMKWKKLLPDHCIKPRVAILLGGNSHHHSMTPEVMEYYGSKLRQLAVRQPMSFLITPSRRTPADALSAFKTALGDSHYFLWNGLGDNPYYGFLGLADYILVTNDSISMISEVLVTKKPVYVLELDGGSTRINAFNSFFEERGFIRPFEGVLEDWTYDPPRDAQNVTKIIMESLKKIKAHLPRDTEKESSKKSEKETSKK